MLLKVFSRRQYKLFSSIFKNAHKNQINYFVQRSSDIKFEVDKSMESFTGRDDRFNGVTVRSEIERCPIDAFPKKLETSLAHWLETRKRGIWFRVNLQDSEWIPILAQNKFTFHHARSDFVMMIRWLPTDETPNIPPYAHTLIGVGAIVINDKSELLVVKEKYNILPTSMWKLPGGYVEPGENLADAAIREVHEETNISSEFISLVVTLHGHGRQWNCSDIYSVMSLKPVSSDLTMDTREIKDCRWMPVDEYLNSDEVHELNKFVIHRWLEMQKQGIIVECKHGLHALLKKPYTIYYADKQIDDGSSSSKL